MCRERYAGEVLRPAYISSVGILLLCVIAGATLMRPGAKVAARESAKYCRTTRVSAFTLERVVNLFDPVGHYAVFAVKAGSSNNRAVGRCRTATLPRGAAKNDRPFRFKNP